MAKQQPTELMTIEEYQRLVDDPRYIAELSRGCVVREPRPNQEPNEGIPGWSLKRPEPVSEEWNLEPGFHAVLFLLVRVILPELL